MATVTTHSNSSSGAAAERNAQLPLAGLLVLDFGQFLSAPSAALRLADLGARVIKVERAGSGDICRRLYISNMELDGDSTLFHAINRNKESFAADLRNPADAEEVLALIRQADVLIQNFRPGVMERLGFHYDAVQAINPAIVYGEITGYGHEGPWVGKPGQDLLVQSVSGLTGLREGSDEPPMPQGLALTDMIAGAHLAQGILSCLVRRTVTGRGAHVAVSLLESALDLQADEITARLTATAETPKELSHQPERQCIYAVKDGYVAAAENHAADVANLTAAASAVTADELIATFEPAGYDCAKVLSWTELREEPHFGQLDMVQQVTRAGGTPMRTTCCPIRIDGTRLRSGKGSPRIGEHTEAIRLELIHKLKEDTTR